MDIKYQIMGEIKLHGKINRKGLMDTIPWGPEVVEKALKQLIDDGIIIKDSRFYYRDTSVYHYQARKPKVEKVSIPKNIETMFEQIVSTLTNLLEDTKNAVEEAKRLRIENQNLIEKIIQINTLLHKKE